MAIRRYAVLTLLFLLAVSKSCFAEPSSTTRYLMDEPVSLMDFGLFTLQQHLSTIGDGDPYVNPIIDYDWDLNKIRIYVWHTGHEFKTRNEAKDWGSSIICEIRKLLGIDCSTVKPLVLTGSSLVFQYFSHRGHKFSAQTKNLGREVDKIVEIVIGAYWGKSEDSKGFLRCEVPLLGTEIVCSD